MQIKSLQVSNILSFPYVEDIDDADTISFDSGLNIIIGENGSGKSTALEILNFLFKRVIFKQYTFNQELFGRRRTATADERRNTLTSANDMSISGFRLEPNWRYANEPQKIKIVVALDEIDHANMQKIQQYRDLLSQEALIYSPNNHFNSEGSTELYTLIITLNQSGNQYSIAHIDCQNDFGFIYLSDYHYFKEAINIHNLISVDNKLEPMSESFTLIGSYRNYHAFQPSVNLRDAHPSQLIQNVHNAEYKRSLNESDSNEPSVFSLVRLRVAAKHFELIASDNSVEQSETLANDLDFMLSINRSLSIVNLRCEIRVLDLRTWQYAFNFRDLRRGVELSDINSLSAGQKAIIHLVFEAYGRGEVKGGVVIIDEPEIHLHYQFQHEYLRVIRELNRDMRCQYILVTHSEALINSDTIRNVRRFALSADGETRIYAPVLNEGDKLLIKILDNTRSTYAFFAKKVVLVEGDTDRYFFAAQMHALRPDLAQEIAILHVGGKLSHNDWKRLFSLFGLRVFVVSDFDYILESHYVSDVGTRLRIPQEISDFKDNHGDWQQVIETLWSNDTFILKHGDLEQYLGVQKGLDHVISFCKDRMEAFLASGSIYALELNHIHSRVVGA